jgi:hypothetical protein
MSQHELHPELFKSFAYDFISTLLLRKFSRLVRIFMKGTGFVINVSQKFSGQVLVIISDVGRE